MVVVDLLDSYKEDNQACHRSDNRHMLLNAGLKELGGVFTE